MSALQSELEHIKALTSSWAKTHAQDVVITEFSSVVESRGIICDILVCEQCCGLEGRKEGHLFQPCQAVGMTNQDVAK